VAPSTPKNDNVKFKRTERYNRNGRRTADALPLHEQQQRTTQLREPPAINQITPPYEGMVEDHRREGNSKGNQYPTVKIAVTQNNNVGRTKDDSSKFNNNNVIL